MGRNNMLLDRLRTFPVIALLALLAAGGFGFVVGAVTGDTVAAPPQTAGAARADDSAPRYNPLSADVNRPRSGGGTGHTSTGAGPATVPDAPANGGEPGKLLPGGDKLARPRTLRPTELPPGRVDEVQSLPAPPPAAGSITVEVEDLDGRRLPYAQLDLSVKSGPLGFQSLGLEPRNMGRGTFQFSTLAAGEYRVASENPHYRAVEEVVQLGAGEERTVRLVLNALERGRVEFFVRLPDQAVPEQVTVQMRGASGDETRGRGRFGVHEPVRRVGPGIQPNSSTARYVPDAGSGLIPFSVAVGNKTRFVFSSQYQGRPCGAEQVVEGSTGVQQFTVVLVEGDIGRDLPTDGQPRTLSRLELTLTLNGGKPVSFTRVNLRQSPTEFAYREPNRIDGGRFTWEGVLTGRWFVVAEAKEFHAAWVSPIEVGQQEAQSMDIVTGHLRVVANLDPANPAANGPAIYQVRLRPLDSGTIERVYRGNLAGVQQDYIDFFMPAGTHTIRLDGPGPQFAYTVEPQKHDITVTGGDETVLEFTLRSAGTLKFVAVNGAGQPVPNAEFLVTTYPAGSAPESEKAGVRKGGADGACSAPAPFGAAYLFIWTESADWNNPDKVLRIELPAGGTLDLGALVVAP
ncbi:MAG: hypothetical protein IT463_06940 [Planctomycetes bacterium]|nr:hypothetical protein [Planctomycetota bacterium]